MKEYVLTQKLTSHLIAFLAGAIIIYWASPFEAKLPESEESDKHEQSPFIAADLQTGKGAENTALQRDDKLQVAQLKNQIKVLEKKLRSLSNISVKDNLKDVIPNTEKQTHQQEAPGLKTMSMEDFESSMKTSFTDQFKGVVLELEGKRLEDVKSSFTASIEKNEWSNEYENSIANYLSEHDQNGDHYLQSLSCNVSVCRLEVNTNDSEQWNLLYARMTRESWYESITIQEKSDYPGNVIYYLPSFRN